MLLKVPDRACTVYSCSMLSLLTYNLHGFISLLAYSIIILMWFVCSCICLENVLYFFGCLMNV